jgi:hypothetical protein
MRAKLTIEQMQVLAKKRGGACLSTVYVNSNTPLRWRCAEGHEWEATPDGIKNNDTWCPTCGGTLRGTIEQMQALAKAHGGVCLSTVYVNKRTKLRWRCAEGHEWDALPGSVKHMGSWCPACVVLLRGTIEQMQVLAQGQNGVCLSKWYVNTRTELRWRCAEGHEWDATPTTMKLRVKAGYWCQKCPGVAQHPAPA